ncbi:MAG: NAD-binding protein [Halarcobacter ebronensis]
MHITYGNADDKDLLQEVGIEDAVAIISATNDDTTNLSVLATAKKLNPKIMTIARENEMEDFSIFKSAKIDHIFMPSRILINKTTNALINPLSDRFIRLMSKEDDKWASSLVRDLSSKIDEFPLLKEITIDKKNAFMIYEAIDKKEEITLKLFTRSLYNRDKENNIIPLLLQRGEEYILLPSLEEKIQKNDAILFACDENAQSDIEYICQNIYEFHYALTGKEKSTIFKKD